MAKLAASEASMFSTWAAVQTLGGAGYIRDSLPQKWFRDAKLDEIWDGTSDIMRLVIARSLFSLSTRDPRYDVLFEPVRARAGDRAQPLLPGAALQRHGPP